MRLYLVRHAAVAVRPDTPASEWHLSPEGRDAADALAEEPHWQAVSAIYTSPEPKAIGTAQRIAARHGLPVCIERDLREVEGRSWVSEGYRDVVQSYLAGEPVDGWEPREEALRRARSCIEAIVARGEGHNVAAVSHGLVLTLYLAGLLALDAAAFDLWASSGFPDVAVIDVGTGRLERAFGAVS